MRHADYAHAFAGKRLAVFEKGEHILDGGMGEIVGEGVYYCKIYTSMSTTREQRHYSCTQALSGFLDV